MNMNDLRAIAYGKKENLGKVETDAKNVQPFVPKTFIKSEEEKEPEKNVKAFVPKRIQKEDSDFTPLRTPEIKPFTPPSFTKVTFTNG